ncbi:PHD finger protein 21A-like isoform X2 [Ptychodera flava]|uniref:PHD finger protein 21A-like isoform X2 n=1 Tax=Ptychodera flava TaxID=63121 RepID=UPI00396A7AAC
MKMSNTELEGLQSQLRKEIQSHQVIVMKIQNDPQNPELQRQLHEHQAKIMALSDKQKKVVQQLRKELGVKKDENDSPQNSLQKPNTDLMNPKQSVIPTGPSAIVSPTRKPPIVLTVDRPKMVRDVPKLIPSPPGPGRISIIQNKPTTKLGSISAPLKVPQLNKVLGQSNRPPPLMNQTQRSTFSYVKRPSTPNKHTQRVSPSDLTKSDDIISKSVVKPGEGKKVEFMAALGLITPKTLEEIRSKRTERKRRSTANPQFSNYGQYEPDRKRHVGSYLSAHPTTERKRRGRPPKFSDSRPSSPEDNENCAINQCSVKIAKSQLNDAGKEGQWPGTLAIVHSYIAHKTTREEEKRKLVKRHTELQTERTQLETKAQQLKEKIMHEMKLKAQLLENNKKTQTAIDKLKNFLKLFQVTPS